MIARFFCSPFIFLAVSVFWIPAYSLMKRDAGEGKFYVFSSREGCVSVASAEPCPVSWKLNTDVANVYETQNEAINATLKRYIALQVNKQCRNDLKATLCSQATPRCFEEGGRDYGDAKKTCEKLYGSCPEVLVKAFKRVKLCESLKTGVHPKGDCVSPPRLITGVCPQPKHKLPLDQFIAYEQRSKNNVETFKKMENASHTDGTRLYSPECLLKLKEIVCLPLYCSADEKYLLIKRDQADCNNTVRSCFERFLNLSSNSSRSELLNIKQKIETACDTYPKATTAETQLAPPAVVVAQPTPTGVVAQPTPTVAVAQPTATGVVAQPTPTGVIAQPTPTGVVAQPTPTGVVAQPTPTGVVAQPTPTGVVAQPTATVAQPTPTVSVAQPTTTIVIGQEEEPTSSANSHLPQLVLLFVCFFTMFSV